MAEDRRSQQPQPTPDETAGREGREAPTTTGGSGSATRTQPPGEVGGPKGPEPTRYGDWEKGGRCIDF